MRVRRLIAAGVVAAATATAVAACGGGDKGASSGSPASQGKPVTLTVWDFGYFPDLNKPGLEKIDKQFMQAHPNITIKHIGLPYATAFERYRAASAARKGPDLISIYPGAFAADYRQGLSPLEGRLTAEQKQQMLLLDISKAPDGHTYALPWTIYGEVFFYNKKHFAKAGIKGAPQSWSELLSDCSKLRSAGIQPLASGLKDGYQADWLQYIFAVQLLSKDELAQLVAGKLPLDSPRMVQALQTLPSLKKAGCFADGGEGRISQDAWDGFKAGKAAMLVGSDAMLKVNETALGKSTVGVIQPPVVPGSPYQHMMDVGPNHGYGITKYSPNQDAAWTYLSYLVSPEAQKIQFDTRGALPSTRGVTLKTSDPNEQQIINWVSQPGNQTVYLSLPQSVSAVLERRAAALVNGKISAEDVAKEMEQTMQQVRPKLGVG